MKKLILIISLLLAGQVAYGQRLWGSDEILFAQNRYYANVSIGWTSTKGGGSTLSIIPEVGRILEQTRQFRAFGFCQYLPQGLLLRLPVESGEWGYRGPLETLPLR